jgi:hypothetical protein
VQRWAEGIERNWIDLKQPHDLEDGRKLYKDDKRNLAKCVSCFANTGGGIVLWGFDKSGHPKPCTDAKAFAMVLLEVGSEIVDPHVRGLDAVVIRPNENSPSGYVAMFIEASNRKHQVRGEGVYYGRFGSKCKPLGASDVDQSTGAKLLPQLHVTLVPSSAECVVSRSDSNSDKVVLRRTFNIRVDNDGSATASILYGHVTTYFETGHAVAEGIRAQLNLPVEFNKQQGDRVNYTLGAGAGGGSGRSFTLHRSIAPGHFAGSIGLITVAYEAEDSRSDKSMDIQALLLDLLGPVVVEVEVAADGSPRSKASMSLDSTNMPVPEPRME